jgi:hypothetical protein
LCNGWSINQAKLGEDFLCPTHNFVGGFVAGPVGYAICSQQTFPLSVKMFLAKVPVLQVGLPVNHHTEFEHS